MVLDTNIIIAYLLGEEIVVETIRQWFAEGRALFISVVTYAEVLAMREASPDDLSRMRQLLALFPAVPVDISLAEDIAALKRSEKIKFPDAVVVATALHTASTLVTRDKRIHKIKGLAAFAI